MHFIHSRIIVLLAGPKVHYCRKSEKKATYHVLVNFSLFKLVLLFQINLFLNAAALQEWSNIKKKV